MNYLGHAYLSFGDAEILTGNMIGDHVKGRLALDNYSPGIKKGLLLHRKIDEYSDNHPATKRAKLFFREDYGLYSGAIMDTLYDHFLASDPKMFRDEATLLAFTQQTFAQLEANKGVFPEKFAKYFPHMVEHNWLYGYRNLKGMEKALGGLNRRALYMPPPQKAYEIFVTNFYQLNQCYYEIIDDLISFVKNELNN
jgi:acyl carrier protein phosphodiesterase